MKKLYIITILFLCLIQYVNSVDAGSNYEIANVPVCYGPLTVIVRGELPFQPNEYSLDGFRFVGKDNKDDIWVKSCNNDLGEENISITVRTDIKTKNTYNFRIQYYIGKYQNPVSVPINESAKLELENENNKRNVFVGNTEIIPVEPKKTPFKLPQLPDNPIIKWSIIIFLLVIIVLIVGLGGYLLFRVFWKSDDTVVSEAILNQKEPTDDEVMEFLRKNVK